jgi:hypothetical protein
MFNGNRSGQFVTFFEKLKDEYAQVSPRFSGIKVGPRNYLSRGIGITGVNLTFGVDKGAGMVQLHVRYSASNCDPELLKRFSEFIKQNRQKIEAELGTELQWNVLYNAFSILKLIPSPGFFADHSTWPGVRKGMAEWMKKFEDVFVPLVQKFKYGEASTANVPNQETQIGSEPTESVVATEASVESDASSPSQAEDAEPTEQPADDLNGPSTEAVEGNYVFTGDDMPLTDEHELQDPLAV